MQILNAAILEYVMYMQGRVLIRNVVANIGPPPNVAGVIADTIYIAIAVVQAVKITTQMLDILLPIPHMNKGMTFRKALTKACDYLGYGFNTTIQDIDLIYLPSKPDTQNKTKGIPHSQDYGYNCLDMFELCARMFKAKYAIVDGVVQFHNIKSTYWTKLSTYRIPPTIGQKEVRQFNIGELKGTKVYTFEKDLTDEWTIKNWTGTNCEIITNTNIYTANKYSLNNGFEEVNFRVALGNYLVNSDINVIMQSIRGTMLAFADVLTQIKNTSQKIFKGAPNSLKQIDNFIKQLNDRAAAYNVGVLKVSGKTWSVPKVLPPAPGNDNRTVLSAYIIYSRYHIADSFLPANKFGQKAVYEGIEVPFKFSNFIELLDCSYATSYHGDKQAKVESIRWAMDKDKAKIDYWVNEIFDQTLTETVIIP